MHTLTMKRGNETRYNVIDDKRLIGFVMRFQLRGVDGWRFIANRKEIAAKMPVPPTAHVTPDEALADIRKRLG